MKRLWFGVALLAALLAAGAGLSFGITALHEQLARQLDDACAAMEQEDWETATALAASAKAKWERSRYFIASCVDHEPLEQLDSLFSELEVYRHRRMSADYAAVCSHLAHISRAIGESHALKWWNLL